jgi:subtilase family serine protease
MRHVSVRPLTLRGLLVTSAVAVASLAGASAALAAPRAAIPAALSPKAGTLPSLGHASLSEPVDVLVGLRLRDEAGLDRLIARVSDPSSSSYGHYLSPAGFRARYAPSAASVAAVSAFATAAGLQIGEVPSNRLYVELRGTVAQAEQAFDTRLDRFNVDGRIVHAPVRTPSVPAALAGIVTGIEGLDTGDVAKPATPAGEAPAAFVNAGPCSAYWGEKAATGTPAAYGDPNPRPYAPCGYTPAQLEGAYGVRPAIDAGLDGSGQTVGIIDAYASATAKSDADTWSSKHGLPPVDYTDASGPLPGAQPEVPGPVAIVDPEGWAGEQELDIEAVHAMAPKAKIVYRGAASPLNVFLTRAQNDMVANKRAQIVSNSYGSASDSASATTHAVLQQAAAEGIGFYFSSGDEGDETQDPNGPGDREVDSSANDPLATAVGGTSLAVGADDGYLFETGWGTASSKLTDGAWAPSTAAGSDVLGDWIYGGGGGTSQAYGEPDYQRGVVPDSISSYFAGKPAEASQGSGFTPIVPGRAVPDVAMDGDPNTGMLEGITQDYAQNPEGVQLPTDDVHYGEYRIGGTSLASPLFAGVMALADQAAGTPHGFANPALYGAAATAAFRDVTSPAQRVAVVRNDYANGVDASGGLTTSLRTMNQVLTLSVVPGYDDTTGLGSPNGLAFLRALAPGSTLVPADPAPAPDPTPTSGGGSTPTSGGGSSSSSGGGSSSSSESPGAPPLLASSVSSSPLRRPAAKRKAAAKKKASKHAAKRPKRRAKKHVVAKKHRPAAHRKVKRKAAPHRAS